MKHFTQDDAARWVSGVLDDDAAALLEAHAKSCAPCEALLQREASIDAQLTRAVALASSAGPRRRLGPALAVMVPLALAASLLLMLWPHPVSLSAHDAGVAVAPVELTDQTEAPPHYEHDHQVPPGALSATAPVSL